MPISNYLAPSAIAKPGVCTSSTRPASPYEGQVIYETDTDKTLVWNGSAWVFLSTGTANPVGLEFITQTSLSGASVNISNCFNGTYDSYRIVISGLKCNTGARFVDLAFLPTTTTGYNTSFYWTHLENVTATTASNTSVFRPAIVADSTNYGGGVIDICNPFLSVQTMFTAQGSDPRTTGGFFRASGGWHNQTNSYTGISIICTGDTFTHGKAIVYGYKMS
jgi:hypothetical protein